MNSWKPILAALVIFSAGLITGRLTVELDSPQQGPDRVQRHGGRRGPWPPPKSGDSRIQEMADRFAKELDLTEGQREEAEIIIRETHEEVGRLAEGFNPKIREAFRNMDTRLREILTTEQAAKFDEMMRIRRENWKARKERSPEGGSMRRPEETPPGPRPTDSPEDPA